MALKCVKAFTWAHGGNRVRQYEPGDAIDDDAELAPIALERGWAKEEGAGRAAAPSKDKKKAFPPLKSGKGKKAARGRGKGSAGNGDADGTPPAGDAAEGSGEGSDPAGAEGAEGSAAGQG